MKQHGFSMIELIVCLVILSVLGATAGYGLTGGVRAFSENTDVLQTLGKLRYASERMVREVREIRRNTANTDAYDIVAMTSTTLIFTRGNGAVVALRAVPPLLTLAYDVPAGPWILTDEVRSMEFSYFQEDGITSATSNTDVAFIEFDMELSRAGRHYPQRTRVALRNQQ